jgi:hypothetical protein
MKANNNVVARTRAMGLRCGHGTYRYTVGLDGILVLEEEENNSPNSTPDTTQGPLDPLEV